jgi:hypothetical protein
MEFVKDNYSSLRGRHHNEARTLCKNDQRYYQINEDSHGRFNIKIANDWWTKDSNPIFIFKFENE